MPNPTYTHKGQYYFWDDQLSPADLADVIDDSITIKRRAFREAVNRSDLAALEERLGYATHQARGLPMSSDRRVTYHRSTYMDSRVYFVRQFGINYFFKLKEG